MPFAAAGCAPAAGSEALAAAIDGTDGEQWSLPLSPLSASSIPEAYSPGMFLPKCLQYTYCDRAEQLKFTQV